MGRLIEPRDIAPLYLSPRTQGFLGDSLTAADIQQTTGLINTKFNRGLQQNACFHSRGQIITKPEWNKGISGDETSDLIARLADALDIPVGLFFILIGTNNANNFAAITADLETIWDAALETGALVVASTILPRTLSTASTRNFFQRVNDYIRSRDQAKGDRFHVFDGESSLVDPASATWSKYTLNDYDGLHNTYPASYTLMKRYVAWCVERGILGAVERSCDRGRIESVVDVYDATNNPSGNLMLNPFFTGTGGSNPGGANLGTLEGDVADSFVLSGTNNGGNLTGLTVSLEKGENDIGQKITISGTAASAAGAAGLNNTAFYTLRQDKSSSIGITNGDVLRGRCDVEMMGDQLGISGIELQVLATVGGVNYVASDGGCGGDNLSSAVPGVDGDKGVLETNDFTIPAGSITLLRVAIRIYIRPGNSRAVDFAAIFRNLKVYKVT